MFPILSPSVKKKKNVITNGDLKNNFQSRTLQL